MSAQKLADMIKKAIHDCELTTSEYDKILAMADADQTIDKTEKALLQQLQEMLGNGTVKKVKG